MTNYVSVHTIFGEKLEQGQVHGFDPIQRSCKTKQNKNIRTEGTTGTTGGVLSIRRVCRGWEKRLFSTRQPTPLKHLATNAW